MKAVAERSGVPPRTVYNHFPTPGCHWPTWGASWVVRSSRGGCRHSVRPTTRANLPRDRVGYGTTGGPRAAATQRHRTQGHRQGSAATIGRRYPEFGVRCRLIRPSPGDTLTDVDASGPPPAPSRRDVNDPRPVVESANRPRPRWKPERSPRVRPASRRPHRGHIPDPGR